MRLLLPLALAACTGPAADTADTASGDTAADTASGDTAADTADTGDVDTGDVDTADTSDTGDTDTGVPDALAGAWSGTLHLDVTEGGFAVATGTCEAKLTVSLPDDLTADPPGTGSLTCTTGTTSTATWTLVGESRTGDTWSGTATVAVTGWPSGTAHFAGRAERGTLALDVDAGGMAQGEWSYGWGASSATLFRE